MFEGLADGIAKLSVPPHAAAIAEALALRDRLDAKITDAVGAFDAAGLWDLESATSMTAWLRHHGGMTKREAAHVAGRAKRLRGLPMTAAAWQAGELSGGQADAIVANVKPEHEELFAEQEADLVPTLVGLSVTQTSRVMGHWAAYAAALCDAPEQAEPERSLHLSQTLDGRWILNGTLDPSGGQVVSTALRMADSPDSEAEPARSPTERRADALTDVCRFYLNHQHHRPAGRHRPHLNVVVDFKDAQAGGSGRAVDGSALDGSTIAALLCDSALHRVVMAGRSTILDYGTRTIPTTLWNALVVRDEHCRFPGCDRQSSWCEGHHVVHIADDGPTCIENLVLVCSRHHHRLHQPGWHAKLRPDATLEVTDPSGRHWSTAPPRAGPTLV